MRPPFVVRIDALAEETARRIAEALRGPLAERGAAARVEAGTRGLPGVTASVAVSDGEGPRWLMPFRLPDEPQAAARDVVTFLERWGFVSRPRATQRAA